MEQEEPPELMAARVELEANGQRHLVLVEQNGNSSPAPMKEASNGAPSDDDLPPLEQIPDQQLQDEVVNGKENGIICEDHLEAVD